MYRTEKCHWVNGYQVRGGHCGTQYRKHRSLALSIGNFGVLIAKGGIVNKLTINLYRLEK